MSNWVKLVLSEEFTISKRMLGIVCALGGLAGAVMILLYDVLREGSSFGPFQKLTLIVSIGVIFVGLTLIPLKNRPA
jgi:hypothetical protein